MLPLGSLLFVKFVPTVAMALLVTNDSVPSILSDSAGIAMVSFICGAGATYPLRSSRPSDRVVLALVASIVIVGLATLAMFALSLPITQTVHVFLIVVISAFISVVILVFAGSTVPRRHVGELGLVAMALTVCVLMRMALTLG